MDSFAVLAEPTRRRILDELRRAERSVGELVTTLDVSQPTMSKHLKVLREAGFVSVRIAAQQRVYRIELGPLASVDECSNRTGRCGTSTSTPWSVTSTAWSNHDLPAKPTGRSRQPAER